MGPLSTNDLERIKSTYPEASNSQLNRAPDTIWETQPLPKSKGSMYNDIISSIGVDSPNTSTESRREEVREHNQDTSLIDITIRNSVSSLMAIEEHELTPRQRNMWNVSTSLPIKGENVSRLLNLVMM